jgi:Rieske Fe-S protein
MNEQRVTRRELIHRTLRAVAASAIVPLVFLMKGKTLAEGSNRTKKQPANFVLDLDDERYAELKRIGGAVFVDMEGNSRSVIVHRVSGDEVAAFSSKCTHAGCKVELPRSDKVVCKCHNSMFDGRGKRLSGPASRDLEQFNAKLEGNTIVISMQ